MGQRALRARGKTVMVAGESGRSRGTSRLVRHDQSLCRIEQGLSASARCVRNDDRSCPARTSELVARIEAPRLRSDRCEDPLLAAMDPGRAEWRIDPTAEEL